MYFQVGKQCCVSTIQATPFTSTFLPPQVLSSGLCVSSKIYAQRIVPIKLVLFAQLPQTRTPWLGTLLPVP